MNIKQQTPNRPATALHNGLRTTRKQPTSNNAMIWENYRKAQQELKAIKSKDQDGNLSMRVMSPPPRSQGLMKDQSINQSAVLSDGGPGNSHQQSMGRKTFRKHHNDESVRDKRAELRDCGLRPSKKMQSPVKAPPSQQRKGPDQNMKAVLQHGEASGLDQFRFWSPVHNRNTSKSALDLYKYESHEKKRKFQNK